MLVRRHVGSMSLMDLLLMVLIAEERLEEARALLKAAAPQAAADAGESTPVVAP